MRRSPWSHWRRLLGEENGCISAAVDHMQIFFQENATVVTASEALHELWRLHCSDNRVDYTGVMLALVIAEGLEMELASLLLQSDPADTSSDLLALGNTAEQWRTHGTLPCTSSTVWLQLAHVVTIHLGSCADSLTKKELLNKLQEELKSHGVEIQTVRDHPELHQADSMAWSEFLSLGISLEQSALMRSKDGREMAQQLEEIVVQQQSYLEKRHHRCSAGTDPMTVAASDEREMDQGGLWRVASCFMQCLAQVTERVKSPPSRNQRLLEVCGNDASLASYVRAMRQLNRRSELDESVPTELNDLSTDEAFEDEERICQAMAELLLIEDPMTLSVRVVALLGLQLQRGTPFVDFVSDVKSSKWERLIRKEVNSLTRTITDDEGRPQLMQLLRFAAFHPTAVMEIVLGSALSTSQHHRLFSRLLQQCPILMRWTATNQEELAHTSSEPILMKSIRTALRQLVDQDGDTSTPIESSPVFLLILELTSCSQESSSTQQVYSVLSLDTIVERIFWGTHTDLSESPSSSTTSVSRLFTLLYHLVVQARMCGRRILANTLRTSVEKVVAVYVSIQANKNGDVVVRDLQDILLLLSEELLDACGSINIAPILSNSRKYHDMRIQCLLELHVVHPSTLSDEESEQDLSPIDNGPLRLSHPLWLSIEHALWRLVWARDREINSTSVQRQCGHLCRILKCDFVDDTNAVIAGASVVQNQVARMLLTSGGRVFDRIVDAVDALVLPLLQDPKRNVEAAMSPVTELPKPLRLLEYVLRCWFVAALGDTATASLQNLLSRVMSVIDQAMPSAEHEPALLFRCLQAVGLLHLWLRTAPGDDAVAGTISRVEVAAVRVLFLLQQTKVSDESQEDQPAFRAAVAQVIVSSRLFHSPSVAGFLRSAGQMK